MANESQTFQYGQAMLKNPDTYTKISNAAKFMKTLREELDHTIELGLEGIVLDSDWRERNAMFRWQLEGIQGAVTDAKWRFMVQMSNIGTTNLCLIYLLRYIGLIFWASQIDASSLRLTQIRCSAAP